MKKIIVSIVVIIAIVLLGTKGKGLLEKRKQEAESVPPPSKPTITVRTVSAATGVIDERMPVLAQVEPKKSIKISTKLAGYIEEISVNESQKVRKGDLLLKIDSQEINSNLLSLKSTLSTQKNDLKIAKQIHERNKKLYAIGGLPKEKLDLSELSLSAKSSAIENTKQKIAQLEHQMTYLSIKAPFDGQIDSIFLRSGDLAAAGKPIISMSTIEKKLIISYAPNQSTKIKVGTEVYLNNKKIGKIKTIYTSSKNGLENAEVVLDENIEAPSGTTISVDILTDRANGCMIPSKSIIHRSDGTFVMVYDKDGFSSFKIDIVLSNENRAVVSPCPDKPIATGRESILSSLTAYDNIRVIGESDVDR